MERRREFFLTFLIASRIISVSYSLPAGTRKIWNISVGGRLRTVSDFSAGIFDYGLFCVVIRESFSRRCANSCNSGKLEKSGLLASFVHYGDSGKNVEILCTDESFFNKSDSLHRCACVRTCHTYRSSQLVETRVSLVYGDRDDLLRVVIISNIIFLRARFGISQGILQQLLCVRGECNEIIDTQALRGFPKIQTAILVLGKGFIWRGIQCTHVTPHQRCVSSHIPFCFLFSIVLVRDYYCLLL
jgi:hypothetical protein